MELTSRLLPQGRGADQEVSMHSASTHLIGIMLQRAVITHVSHSVQIRVSLVNVVHVGTVVLLIQNSWKMPPKKKPHYVYL